MGSKVLSVNGLDTLTAHASGYGDDNDGKGEQKETYREAGRGCVVMKGREAVDVSRRRAGRRKNGKERGKKEVVEGERVD